MKKSRFTESQIVGILKEADMPPGLGRLQHLGEWSMKELNKCCPEVHERVVRVAQEHQGEYSSLQATIGYLPVQ